MRTCSRYNYASQFEPDFDSLLTDLRAMLLEGDYVLSAHVAKFETDYAKYNGSAFCVGVNSGTDALLIALRSLGIAPGDEVITHANTFYSTVAAIELAGGRPVLVDADERSWLIDLRAVPGATTPRTRVVIPVHLYGKPTRMADILSVADKNGICVVEDAAQAHGARVYGKRVGTFGIVGCFSFHPSKNLAAAGDAGAIITDDENIARTVREIRALGQRQQNDHVALGYNSKLDSLQARILSHKLERLDAWNADRRRVAHLYRDALCDLPVVFQPEDPDEEHVFHLFQIRSPRRDQLLAHLRQNGVDAVVRYAVPIHLQPAFQHHRWTRGQFPVAEQLAAESLCLPIRPDLTESDIAFVSGCVRSFFEGPRKAMPRIAAQRTSAVVMRRDAHCTVCKGTSEATVFRENGYEGRACACGTIYLTPEPLPGEIDPAAEGHDDAFYELSAPLKARWVRRHVSGRDLLEIGCGNGFFLKAASEVGFDVEGIEADPARATSAARRANAIVRAGLFEHMEAERRFDVVYHCDMLAHFERPADALRRMIQFLRPGGVLAFQVGLVGGLPRFWYPWIGEIGCPQHRWLYSEGSLRRLLNNASMRIDHFKGFDLSALISIHQSLRFAARVARTLRLHRPVARSGSGQNGSRGGHRAVFRLQNILCYRVGARMPRVGPATALVIARPVEISG